jgi:hypothetical protein
VSEVAHLREAGTNGPHTSPLERAQVRIPLIQMLAVGTTSQVELAARYGVTQGAISKFGTRHAAEIQSVREGVEMKVVALGLWIADKVTRVGVLQDDAERIDSWLDLITEDGPAAPDAALLRVKHAALRAVAEELGQLTQKIDATTTVRYELVGVDPEELR